SHGTYARAGLQRNPGGPSDRAAARCVAGSEDGAAGEPVESGYLGSAVPRCAAGGAHECAKGTNERPARYGHGGGNDAAAGAALETRTAVREEHGRTDRNAGPGAHGEEPFEGLAAAGDGSGAQDRVAGRRGE